MFKEMTIIELEQLADFYILDVIDVINDKVEFVKPTSSIHGLHPEDVSDEDFKSIAQFGRIIKNYQKIQTKLKEV
jgi:hypothetical protein